MAELKRNFQKELLEAGCDEAGRGCLAGPVVAAAVILPPRFQCPELDDSKKMTAQKRETAAEYIRKKAIAWAIGVVECGEIDQINILKASIKAMHLALDQLKTRPGFVIVDGNKFYNYKDLPHQTIVDGDALYMSIAAASVLAKTHRDELMLKLHEEYPMYNWLNNKAYSTPEHKALIKAHGISPQHRRSYAPVMAHLQMELFEETEVEA